MAIVDQYRIQMVEISVEILISQNVRHYKIQQHTKILPTLTVLDESTADISVEDAYLPKCPSLLEQKILSSNVIETRIDDHNIIRSVLKSLLGIKNLNTTVLNCLTDAGLGAPGKVHCTWSRYILSVFSAFLKFLNSTIDQHE